MSVQQKSPKCPFQDGSGGPPCHAFSIFSIPGQGFSRLCPYRAGFHGGTNPGLALGYRGPPRWGIGRVDWVRSCAGGDQGWIFQILGGEWWAGDSVRNPGASGFDMAIRQFVLSAQGTPGQKINPAEAPTGRNGIAQGRAKRHPGFNGFNYFQP